MQSTAAVTNDPATRVSSATAPARVLGWSLTILFLTAAGVLNAIVLTWANLASGSWPQPVSILGLALVFAQMGLVALACGFSRQSFVFRSLLFIATVAFSSILASRYDARPDLLGSWLTALLVHGGIASGFARCLRLRGFEMTCGDEPALPRSRPWQFSLAKLFALTTSVAILAALATRWQIEPRALPTMLVLAMFLNLQLVSITCALAGKLSAGGFFLSCAVTFVLACFLGLQLNDVLSALWIMLIHSLLCHTALGIVRLAGYRVVSHLRPSTSSA